jgi:hypothetical protein
VRLRVPARLDELNQTSFAGFEIRMRQPPAKEFVAEPHPVSVDDIAFAVLCDLANASFSVKVLHVSTTDPFRLARQTLPAAQLVQCCLGLEAQRGQDIAEINCVLGVAIEIRPRR